MPVTAVSRLSFSFAGKVKRSGELEKLFSYFLEDIGKTEALERVAIRKDIQRSVLNVAFFLRLTAGQSDIIKIQRLVDSLNQGFSPEFIVTSGFYSALSDYMDCWANRINDQAEEEWVRY